MADLDERLRALAHPDRRAFIRACTEHWRSASDLIARSELAAGTASEHLKVLRKTGLLELDKQGRFWLYRTDVSVVESTYQALLDLIAKEKDETPMTPPPTHGYSGRTLSQKMGLKRGHRCLTVQAPEHYADLVADAEGVKFGTRLREADVVHLFCRNKRDLAKQIPRALTRVAEPGGMLWISWPKKASPLFVDLTEDDLRAALLPLDWVDVKVCAVDVDWSGLKFVRRRPR